MYPGYNIMYQRGRVVNAYLCIPYTRVYTTRGFINTCFIDYVPGLSRVTVENAFCLTPASRCEDCSVLSSSLRAIKVHRRQCWCK